MSWSMEKEFALRRLVAEFPVPSSNYARFLSVLSAARNVGAAESLIRSEMAAERSEGSSQLGVPGDGS